MAQCKICKRKYHACCNCGLQDWEWDYCSERCYQEGIKPLTDFLNTLDISQLKALKELIDKEMLYYDRIKYDIKSKIKERQNAE